MDRPRSSEAPPCGSRRRGLRRRIGRNSDGVALAATVAVIAGLSELGSMMAATMRATGAVGWAARVLLLLTVTLIAVSTLLFASRLSVRDGERPHRALAWSSAAGIVALLAWSLVAATLPGTSD